MNLDGLNEKQRMAAEKTEGPLLILAGAGSGKTRVLTHRIAYLIQEKNVRPSSILAITFTNKAASEMKIRVANLIGDVSSGMWMGTFHSICVKILRWHADKIGYGKDFVIYDPTDQKTLVKECMKELNIDDKRTTPKYALGKISDAKNEMISPEKFDEMNSGDYYLDNVCKVYDLYQRKLKGNNAMDFDDLILKAIEVFQTSKEVLSEYQRRFKYIHVDEYQDTNKAQYLLVRMLSLGHMNLCVVGDNDQSIYGWRGADIRNITEFEKDFMGAEIIKLEQNYRSSKNILNAANCVIKNNLNRKSKNLWTDNDLGDKIRYYKASSETDEARNVAQKVIDMMRIEKRPHTDFAVLYRTNAQSRVIEDAFRSEGIPYKLVGGVKFYDRKEIKDLIAYLRLIQNPVDELSVKRAINVPKRGIGAKTIEKIALAGMERDLSLYEAVLHAAQNELFSKKVNEGLKSFTKVIEEHRELIEVKTAAEMIELVLSASGYLEELKLDNTLESRSRIENLRELISAAKDFEKTAETAYLQDFLEEYSLKADIDKLEDEEDVPSVLFMTMHSAKGLEFPVVFIIGMEENIFPSARSIEENDDVEEERRLAYVGITRAEEKLFISHASVRSMYGKTQCNLVSRFIEEIPKDLIDSPTGEVASRKKKKIAFSQQMKNELIKSKESRSEITDSSALKAGVKVMHKTFGEGTVITTKGSGDEMMLTVAFNSKGIKKLNLKMAPLEVIS